MSIIERIFLFADRKHLAISAIEKKSGISNGFFKKIKHSPSPQKCEDILKAFPELNKNWLLTGEGEMLKSSQQIGDVVKSTIVGANVNGNGNKITHYSAEYDASQKEVEHLKAIIEEKDKIIVEKERLITILLKNQ